MENFVFFFFKCLLKFRAHALQLELNKLEYTKGHPPSADLRYGEEDSISPSTPIFAAIESKLRI